MAKVNRGRLLAGTVLVLAFLVLALLIAGTALAQQPSGSISGTVFCDANDDYFPDPGEGIGGVAVTLYDDTDCNYVADPPARSTQDSAADGTYAFTALEVGADWNSRKCYVVEVDETAPELGMCNFTWVVSRSVSLSGDVISQEVDFPFQQIWDKTVNGQSWVPDMAVTAQTSDTIEVVDVIFLPRYTQGSNAVDQQEPEYRLVETWNPAELDLIDIEWEALTTVVTSSGMLTWTVPMYQGPEFTATLTKTFHVEPCTWTATTLQEELYMYGEVFRQVDSRPVIVNKTPPNLQIGSAYSSEVSPGQQASFTLAYTNTGGFENAAMIRNDFPSTAPFASSAPAPDRQASDGSWAEWDVSNLGTNDSDTIAVTVDIQAGLSPSTTIPITDSIYNHVEEIADTVITRFHIREEPTPTPTNTPTPTPTPTNTPTGTPPPTDTPTPTPTSTSTPVITEPEEPPVVPEASTLVLLGGALTGLASYVSLQVRARRRKED